MSNRERETLEEIRKILKIPLDVQVKLSMIGDLAAPPAEPNPKAVGGTFTFKAKDIQFMSDELGIMGFSPISKDREEEEEGEEEEIEELPQLSTLDEYVAEAEMCQVIFEERNAIYKDTFRILGLWGVITTLVGDAYRLRNMVRKPDHGRSHVSQIEDKLMDVVNQGLIGLMMLHSDNFEGSD